MSKSQKKKEAPILVEALRMGYYDHKRRREGNQFYIAKEKDFSEKWMIKVESGVQAKPEATSQTTFTKRDVDGVPGGDVI